MDRMRSDVYKIIKSPANERDDPSEGSNKNILILEGFILFKDKVITNLCDRKYFVTLTKEECWKRRTERVYDPPDVPGYFEKAVWPEYLKHEAELMRDKNLCDTITFIDGTKSKEEIFEIIFTDIKELLA